MIPGVSENRNLWFLLALALTVRVGFLLMVQPWNQEVFDQKILTGDSPEYHELALRILEGRPLGDLGVRRTPGYPLFLSGAYALSGMNYWVALLLQIVASLVTLSLMYHLACTWFDKKTAFLAGVLFAVEPHAVLVSSLLLSDTIFATLFLAALVLFLKALDSRSMMGFLWAGLLVGIATMVRPVAQFLPVVLIVVTFLMFRKHRAEALRGGSVLLVAYLLVISPWMARNYLEYGHAGLSDKGGQFLLEWVVPNVEAARTGGSVSEIRSKFIELANQQGLNDTDNPFEKSAIRSHIAVNYIKEHPLAYITANINGVIYTFSNLGTRQFASMLGLESRELPFDWFSGQSLGDRIRAFYETKTVGELLIGAFVGVFLVASYLLTIRGCWIAIRCQRYWPVIFTILMGAYFMAFIGPIGVARYKLAFMPLYLIFTALGCSRQTGKSDAK